MTLDGKPYAPKSPRDAIERGVFLAPEDRKRHGLVLPMTIAENTSLPNVRSYARFGLLDRATERKVATAEVSRLRIKAPSIHQRVVNLSGGNQQKVVLGKWLAMNPKVLILDEPTRGIDVGAKAEIYRHMAALAAEGIAILMVSSDMEEILGMSDRVVVMHEQRIKGILSRDELSQERIATLMTGAGRRRKPHETRARHGRGPGPDVPRAFRSRTPTSSGTRTSSTRCARSRCSASSRSASAFVIITGGIDLSIGSVIGLTGVLIAKLSSTAQGGLGYSLWVGIPVALGVALALGLAPGAAHHAAEAAAVHRHARRHAALPRRVADDRARAARSASAARRCSSWRTAGSSRSAASRCCRTRS